MTLTRLIVLSFLTSSAALAQAADTPAPADPTAVVHTPLAPLETAQPADAGGAHAVGPRDPHEVVHQALDTPPKPTINPKALEGCAGKKAEAACKFHDDKGPVSGACYPTQDAALVCMPLQLKLHP